MQVGNIVDKGPEVGPEFEICKQGAEIRVTIRFIVIVIKAKTRGSMAKTNLDSLLLDNHNMC